MMFFFLILMSGYLNSAYHPHLRFKKYIRIKNKFLQKILISDRNPGNNHRKNNKSNLDKLSIIGLIFYILAFVWLFCHIVFYQVERELFSLIAAFFVWLSFLILSINTLELVKELQKPKFNLIANYIVIFLASLFILFLLFLILCFIVG